MDPATAIGLVASIVQLVELGSKITKRLIEFNQRDIEGSPPPAFGRISTTLPLIVADLQRLQSHVSSGKLDSPTQEGVRNIVQKCFQDVKELNLLLTRALPSNKDSSWERGRKVLASLRYDKRIDAIAESLDGYLKVLMFDQVIELSQTLACTKLEPAPKAYWLVPFDRNASFVGRDAIFQQIDQMFQVKEGVQPKAALYGLGGIGKSQIALEYCYRRRKQDERCSVFWCNAATVARFEESLNRIATECNLTSKEDAGVDAAGLLKDWLEFRHEGPWLMIVDNVDDEEVFFKEQLRIGKTPDIAYDLGNQATPIDIREMNIAEALTLARKRLPPDTSEEVLLELLEVLEFIPLAITQASAFIAKRRKTVQYYLELFRKSDATRTKLLTYEFSGHGRQGDSMESVAKTWMLSFEAIRESNLRASELLCLITFFQHQGVPAVLLQSEGEDDFDFQDAAAVLKAFSFIDADEADSVFSTHRLVQLATKWWLEKEAPSETERWASVAFSSLATQFPQPNSHPTTEYFTLCEALLPHAELMLRHEFQNPTQEVQLARAKLLNSSGRYIHWTGSYDEARSRFDQSRQLNLKYLGEKHVDTMTSTGLFGWTLATIDGDAAAVPVLERLVELRTEVLGIDDPQTIDALSDLATAVGTSGDLAKSEAWQRKAVAQSERVLGKNHGDTLNCKEHLASVLDDQGIDAEAMALQWEVYNARLELYGPRHMNVLTAECNLATMLGKHGETFADAYELFKGNTEKKREVCGIDHRETLVTIINYGYLLVDMGRFDEAKELHTQTLLDIMDGPRRNIRSSQEWVSFLRYRLQWLLERDDSEGT